MLLLCNHPHMLHSFPLLLHTNTHHIRLECINTRFPQEARNKGRKVKDKIMKWRQCDILDFLTTTPHGFAFHLLNQSRGSCGTAPPHPMIKFGVVCSQPIVISHLHDPWLLLTGYCHTVLHELSHCRDRFLCSPFTDRKEILGMPNLVV